MNPTLKLRHVWRTVYDGNKVIKVLALQQWWDGVEIKGDFYKPTSLRVACSGEWRDIEIQGDNL